MKNKYHKGLYIILFASLLTLITPLYNNIKAVENNRVSTKINSLIVIGVINPAVEIRLSEKFSFQLEAMGIFQPYGFLNSDNPLTMGTTWGEGRYYFKSYLRGFYAGINAGWGVYRMSKGAFPLFSGSYKTIYQVGSNMMLGISAGYHLTLSKHWGLDFSVGGGYQLSTYEAFYKDGTKFIGLNQSAEWIPYKGGISLVYSF